MRLSEPYIPGAGKKTDEHCRDIQTLAVVYAKLQEQFVTLRS